MPSIARNWVSNEPPKTRGAPPGVSTSTAGVEIACEPRMKRHSQAPVPVKAWISLPEVVPPSISGLPSESRSKRLTEEWASSFSVSFQKSTVPLGRNTNQRPAGPGLPKGKNSSLPVAISSPGRSGRTSPMAALGPGIIR